MRIVTSRSADKLMLRTSISLSCGRFALKAKYAIQAIPSVTRKQKKRSHPPMGGGVGGLGARVGFWCGYTNLRVRQMAHENSSWQRKAVMSCRNGNPNPSEVTFQKTRHLLVMLRRAGATRPDDSTCNGIVFRQSTAEAKDACEIQGQLLFAVCLRAGSRQMPIESACGGEVEASPQSRKPRFDPRKDGAAEFRKLRSDEGKQWNPDYGQYFPHKLTVQFSGLT